MSLKQRARERIKRHQSRGVAQSRMRDRMATPLAESGSIKRIRDAMDREENPLVHAEMQRRVELLERVESSESLRSAEMAKCNTDMFYWFDNYAWTYDPRRVEQPYLPFSLYPKQRTFIAWFADREKRKQTGIVEKSRDAGASWLTMLYLLHHWLFRPGFKGGVGSRKEEYVDETGNPDSLFEKLRLGVHMLPNWMMPRGLKPKNHFAFMKFINPANGATITGEAGDNIGRGGRCSIYVLDEAAFVARPHLVERALMATADVKIYVSTPNGIGNVFYKKRFSKAFPVFTFNWREDERKNHWIVIPDDFELDIDVELGELILPPDHRIINRGQGGGPKEMPEGFKAIFPWYEIKRIEYKNDPVVLAQEVDIDYSASQEGVTIPALWVQAAVNLRLPKSGTIRGTLDVADEGGAKNVLTVRQGPMVLSVYSWSKGNTTQTAWKSINLLEGHGASEFIYDSAGGYGSGIKGAVQSSERRITVSVKGVNVGGGCTNQRWDDGKTAKDKFLNLKAELWWKLRRRFEKTYEYAVQGIQHPLDELISIPDHPDLIAQLSQVQHFETTTGKVKIETKDMLKTRGISSPDFADSLVLSEASVARFDVAAGGPATATPNGGSNFHGQGGSVANSYTIQRERPIV